PAPAIVLIAQPLAAGLPLGAILTTEAVASRVSPGMHGTTFGGGPLACAVALEFLKIVEGEKLLENIRARGAELRDGLIKLAAKFGFIREIRSEGLMIASNSLLKARLSSAKPCSAACSSTVPTILRCVCCRPLSSLARRCA